MRVRHNHRSHGFLLWILVISFIFQPSQSFSNADFAPGFHAGRISEGQFEHPDLNGWMTAQEVEAYLVGVLQCESYRQFYCAKKTPCVGDSHSRGCNFRKIQLTRWYWGSGSSNNKDTKNQREKHEKSGFFRLFHACSFSSELTRFTSSTWFLTWKQMLHHYIGRSTGRLQNWHNSKWLHRIETCFKGLPGFFYHSLAHSRILAGWFPHYHVF